MMKICHLSSVHQPDDTRIFLKECRSAVEAGCNVAYVVPSEQPAATIDGVRIVPVARGKGRAGRMTGTVRRVAAAAISVDADIYQFHDPELLPVGLMLKSKGKRVIYDAHEDTPRQIFMKPWISKKLQKPCSVLFEFFENFAASRMDAIVTATPYIRERFERLHPLVREINNFPHIEELWTGEDNWTTREEAFCFVGGITPERGLFEMMEAARLAGRKLVMAGRFSIPPERYSAAKGWENVEHLGQISRKGVAEVLSRVTAGLVLFHPLPNHVDARPNKLFEYMSAGIPVIASDFPGWRSIVSESECGITVDPLDVAAISEAMKTVASDRSRAKEMGLRGKRAVETRYNWKSEGRRLIDLYSALMSGRG